MKTYLTVWSGIMILFVIALFATSCRRQAKRKPLRFTAAKVTQYYPVERTKKIVDSADISGLTLFFPYLGQGKQSDVTGGWESVVSIDFIKADGTILHIVTDFETWSEGQENGDWPVKGDLENYVNKLFAEP